MIFCAAFLCTLCIAFLYTVHQDAFYGGVVKERQQLLTQVVLFEDPQEVQALSCLLHSGRVVVCPGESDGDERSQEFEAVATLHILSVDGLWTSASC